MSIILALDISSKSTGFAIFKDGQLQKDCVGTIKLNHTTHAERLFFFEKSLSELLDGYNPSLVVIEDIFKGPNIKTFKVLCFFHGIVHKLSWAALSIEPQLMTVSEVRQTLEKKYKVKLFAPRKNKNKKYKSQSFKDSKELTFDFIKKHYKLKNFKFKEHNDVSDAIAVGSAFILLNR